MKICMKGHIMRVILDAAGVGSRKNSNLVEITNMK